MCVIIAVPSGVALPPVEELRAAFATNPHGAGFATKSLHYKSMHFGSFYRHLRQRDIGEACIIHFRLATHGSKKVSNCHPFYKGGVWFAHNGVLPYASIDDRPDSWVYFSQVAYPAMKKYGYDAPEIRVELANMARMYHSKFATLKDGKMRLYGDFTKYNGCYYSNFHHLWRFKYVI